MKKLGRVLLLIAIVLLAGTMSVKAMSEKDLLAKMKKTYTINGEKVKLEKAYINSAERYLDEFTVSKKDCDYIAARIDKAVSILQDAKTTKVSELSKADKNKLKALVEEISANTSVKATLTKDGLIVFNPKTGEVFTNVNQDAIAYTGSNNALIIMAILVSVVGLSAFVLKLNKTNA